MSMSRGLISDDIVRMVGERVLDNALKHAADADTKRSYSIIGVEVDLESETAFIKVNELGTKDKFIQERTKKIRRMGVRLEAHKRALRMGGHVICEYCGQLLLSHKVKKCARCKGVYYCSPDCQKNDWIDHKTTCCDKGDETKTKNKNKNKNK